MLTTDGYRRQWEPLDIDDFTAVHALLEADVTGSKAGRGEYLVFFNGGSDAGCSRVHKHLQAIPQESYGGDPWKNMDRDVLPFAYFEHRFGLDGEKFGAEATVKAYNKGMEAVERSIGASTVADGEQPRAPAHTVLMDRERIVVIPRPKAGTGGVAANAAGMLGMIWTSDEASTQKWLDAGPEKVLKVAGAPKLA
jgi:ATP adenylyltransferase/5',5'''-P-1,P-4-tetraphosphate phosphorylase II